jgi:AcrR family transcriptional regulator
MAKVNMERRAEIGRARSERTRTQLLDAARALFGEQPLGKVSADDVVAKAGVAKGTFYYHFDDMAALTDALLGELAEDVNLALIAVSRTETAPMARVARGFDAFLRKIALDPDWGNLVIRHSSGFPRPQSALRRGLLADLQAVWEAGQMRISELDFAADIVSAIAVEASIRLCAGADAESTIADATGAMLRALGQTATAASRTVARFAAQAAARAAPA